jgi:hypothetical protein
MRCVAHFALGWVMLGQQFRCQQSLVCELASATAGSRARKVAGEHRQDKRLGRGTIFWVVRETEKEQAFGVDFSDSSNRLRKAPIIYSTRTTVFVVLPGTGKVPRVSLSRGASRSTRINFCVFNLRESAFIGG